MPSNVRLVLDPSVLKIEKALARAHKDIWLAASIAENFRDQTTADDLMGISEEVRRVHEDCVKRYRSQAWARLRRA